ncbi:unnamed protein product [Soboliphyme baturini]|uniref:C-type lectin domain-containing protein n=1 Tax=Soboliphyme baturini TaxID=241478 RepID=A0A183J4M0_9BILA|nr:unnamed protein product [Soboliphyme baturini]
MAANRMNDVQLPRSVRPHAVVENQSLFIWRYQVGASATATFRALFDETACEGSKCDDGWFGYAGVCYKFFFRPLSFQRAEESCKEFEAQLFVPHDVEEWVSRRQRRLCNQRVALFLWLDSENCGGRLPNRPENLDRTTIRTQQRAAVDHVQRNAF